MNAQTAQPLHTHEQIRGVAINAARAAGQIQLDYFGRKTIHLDRTLEHDLKLHVDLLCDQEIRSIIWNDFNDHSILTEESGLCDNKSDYIWIVDPLDGSVNFFYGIPHFGSCVACYYCGNKLHSPRNESWNELSTLGQPLVGVVYNPILNELFIGSAGSGATCNDKPITVGNESKLDEALISLSFGSDEETMQSMEKINAKLIRNTRKVRVFGSTSLDIVQVACGRISGLIQRKVRTWDFAAARIVLEQSGGIFDACKTAVNSWAIIACPPGLYAPLKQIVTNL
jgi:fructose-1,6-bisphosphatase/inositol monophosphatase family enzyme